MLFHDCLIAAILWSINCTCWPSIYLCLHKTEFYDSIYQLGRWIVESNVALISLDFLKSKLLKNISQRYHLILLMSDMHQSMSNVQFSNV